MSDTPVIDAQVHAYQRDHPERPWLGFLHGPDEVTGDDMVATMDEVGVDGALLVSPYSMYRYDASYALEVQQFSFWVLRCRSLRLGWLVSSVGGAGRGVSGRQARQRLGTRRRLFEHLRTVTEYITGPSAFAMAFFLFGSPSAPAVTVLDDVADLSLGVGGCASAYAPDPCVDVFGSESCVPCGTAEQLRRNRQEAAYLFAGLALASAKFPPFGFLFGGIALGAHVMSYHTANAMADAGC